MTSYQRRKNEIAVLNEQVESMCERANFFQKAIWEARKATGEQLGVEPFNDMCGDEDTSAIRDAKGLLEIITALPLGYTGAP